MGDVIRRTFNQGVAGRDRMNITVEPADGGGYLLRCACGWKRIYRKQVIRPETLTGAANDHRYEHMTDWNSKW